jgi:CubicO group peptidase (beta-lactamase class C family)
MAMNLHQSLVIGLLLTCNAWGQANDSAALAERDQKYPLPATGKDYYTFAPVRVATFSNWAKYFKSCTIEPSAQPRNFAKGQLPRPLAYSRFPIGGSRNLDDFIDAYPVTSFIAAQGDNILEERYPRMRLPSDTFASFSMAKSITSLLVGIALDEGKIKSLDDPASQYVPSIAASAYGSISVRHLLRMSSGMLYTENYAGMDDNARMSGTLESKGALAAINGFTNKPFHTPGSKFNYAGIESIVLNQVVAHATGQNICQYAQDKLWSRIGAADVATWQLDGSGQAMGQMGFAATARDWVRLGLMIVNDGKVGEQQVISKAYLDEATLMSAQPEHFHKGNGVNRLYGYGYQFWLHGENQPTMLGVYGQHLFMDRSHKAVLLITSAWPSPTVPFYSMNYARLFDDFIESLSTQTKQ